jgi:hypothetical protein
MRLALTGLPLSGVKTIYSAITGHVESGGLHSGASGQARLSVLKVPDPRLDLLAGIFKPRKVVPATVELTEFPGLFGGAQAESQSMAKAREADALALVLRCFESDVAPHPAGSVDAGRDLTNLLSDMALADLAVVENRLERLASSVKRRDNEDDLAEHALLSRIRGVLEEGQGVRQAPLQKEERKRLRGFGFLTAKPMLLILNIGEGQLGKEEDLTASFQGRAKQVEALCASLEAELAQLDEAEQAEFMGDFGVDELAAPRVLAAAYRTLDLRTFLTYGEDEVRAWNVRAGETALDAAGKIHSDLARGFIRAEVIGWQDFEQHQGIKAVKAAGKFRLEGKEYVVQEGDLIIIRHSS